MLNIKKIMLMGTSVVMTTYLGIILFRPVPVSASLINSDNQGSYQTAFLYFLPDFGSKEENNKAENRGCHKIGYTFTRANCEKPRILKDKCPVGNSYKECYCAGSPTCTGSTSNAMPYASSTGASVTSCVDCPGNTLYTWTCSRTCRADISSKPSNSSYTTCKDCSGTHNVGWSCNTGYVASGNSCVCAKTCSDTVTSKPANSSYTTSSCTACGVTTSIKTGWSCNYGYKKSGSSCVKECSSSSSNWCPVHRECHTNCCTDGTIKSCDTRCGGSGCTTSGSGSDSGSGSGSETGGGNSCSYYTSCSAVCTGVGNTVAHCQNTFAPKYYVNCTLNIRRTWTDCDGQTHTDEGSAYDRKASYSTQAECDAAAKNTSCSCSSYRWPYCCEKSSACFP